MEIWTVIVTIMEEYGIATVAIIAVAAGLHLIYKSFMTTQKTTYTENLERMKKVYDESSERMDRIRREDLDRMERIYKDNSK